MAIYEVSAKRKFNSGVVKFEPGMSIRIHTDMVSSSIWTQARYRRAMAEAFVSQYGLSCPVEKFEQQINNVNFDYILISKQMYTYDKNQEILEKWTTRAAEMGDGDIYQDGVYYKGDRYPIDNGKLERDCGGEDKQWNKACRRILFISKDPNESGNPYDMRCCELTHNADGSLAFGGRFVKNMLRITAGLATISAEGYLPWDKVNDVTFCDKVWNETAVARINLKKNDGGASIDTAVLASFAEKYKDLIVSQIKLHDANIIVCCGGSSYIKNFVVDNIYNDAEKLNNWIYYSQSKNVWIIDAYHMNPRSATTDEALYNDIMSNFNEALKVKNISTPER